MESTGAWGRGMQQHWKQKIIPLHAERVDDNVNKSRSLLGLPSTWSANNFNSYWAQRISITYQRHLAESIEGTVSAARYTSAGLRARRSQG